MMSAGRLWCNHPPFFGSLAGWIFWSTMPMSSIPAIAFLKSATDNSIECRHSTKVKSWAGRRLVWQNRRGAGAEKSQQRRSQTEFQWAECQTGERAGSKRRLRRSRCVLAFLLGFLPLRLNPLQPVCAAEAISPPTSRSEPSLLPKSSRPIRRWANAHPNTRG